MSLYHEAAVVLEATSKNGGSIKSQVYGTKSWKSDPKTLFALSTETAKWSEVLKEVVERSDILNAEKHLSPILALVLAHDLLLSKKGVALPSKHGLTVSIHRHKARLGAELTKVRLRRGLASVEALRASVNDEDPLNLNQDRHVIAALHHPRWIRVNTLLTSLRHQLETTFSEFTKTTSLIDVLAARKGHKLLYVDEHIPNLIAVPSQTDLWASEAYAKGYIIFQDKASCFPALLLDAGDGDIIDACAAPGNKTTHLAATVHDAKSSPDSVSRRVIACEKDASRSTTLQKMVKIAGAEKVVSVKAKQDFLKLDPNAKDCANVTALLLDPSCSGSGIVGRDEGGVIVHLPTRPPEDAPKGTKRKRGTPTANIKPAQQESGSVAAIEETQVPAANGTAKSETRLTALSSFQQRLLEHAMLFPAARRITYSTCSIYAEENEHIIMKALQSTVAIDRGWQILRRERQVDGMRKWHIRGAVEGCRSALVFDGKGASTSSIKTVAEACIRCEKGTEDGTMGFFVAGFVRVDDDELGLALHPHAVENCEAPVEDDDGASSALGDEWNGFSGEE